MSLISPVFTYDLCHDFACALSPSDDGYCFQHSPQIPRTYICEDVKRVCRNSGTSRTKAGNVILHLRQCQVRILLMCMRPVPLLKFFLCMESRYIYIHMNIISPSSVREDIWYIWIYSHIINCTLTRMQPVSFLVNASMDDCSFDPNDSGLFVALALSLSFNQ